jgi:formylglycine-generating enzyme required for sulfatase activity
MLSAAAHIVSAFLALAIAGGAALAGEHATPGGSACHEGVSAQIAGGAKLCVKPGTGESFKDCADCPEMVIAPAGSFTMGTPEAEEGHQASESLQHEVRISKPFAAGRFSVTFAQWDACVADGGCGGYRPDDKGWGRDDRPVINVNWNDAKAYVRWLSNKTGHEYRLLSEAEREYAARAGATTPFWWGTPISTAQANFNGDYTYSGDQKGENRKQTLPVKSFQANPWGLYQVHGNVWEWVEDCWNESYRKAPADGTAWTAGDCTRRVLRGGSWSFIPHVCRSGARAKNPADFRAHTIGFRLARTLE